MILFLVKEPDLSCLYVFRLSEEPFHTMGIFYLCLCRWRKTEARYCLMKTSLLLLLFTSKPVLQYLTFLFPFHHGGMSLCVVCRSSVSPEIFSGASGLSCTPPFCDKGYSPAARVQMTKCESGSCLLTVSFSLGAAATPFNPCAELILVSTETSSLCSQQRPSKCPEASLSCWKRESNSTAFRTTANKNSLAANTFSNSYHGWTWVEVSLTRFDVQQIRLECLRRTTWTLKQFTIKMCFLISGFQNPNASFNLWKL